LHAIREYTAFTDRVFLIDLIRELEDICCIGRVIMSGDGFELCFLLGREVLLELLQDDS
jgi:hypothetical protein